MTGMSGRQTVTEIRKMIKKESPFILLTAYDINVTINKSEEISTDGVLAKPFFVSKLRTTLDEILPGNEQAEDTEKLGPDRSKSVGSVKARNSYERNRTTESK
ncbi:MAG: response regulator [Eubacterium sp.]|nr:response regulator [Eubacterium sp.]